MDFSCFFVNNSQFHFSSEALGYADSRIQSVIAHFKMLKLIPPQWLDNREILEHEGGDLPFEVDITKELKTAGRDSHRLTVAVNNTLQFTSSEKVEDDRR